MGYGECEELPPGKEEEQDDTQPIRIRRLPFPSAGGGECPTWPELFSGALFRHPRGEFVFFYFFYLTSYSVF